MPLSHPPALQALVCYERIKPAEGSHSYRIHPGGCSSIPRSTLDTSNDLKDDPATEICRMHFLSHAQSGQREKDFCQEPLPRQGNYSLCIIESFLEALSLPFGAPWTTECMFGRQNWVRVVEHVLEVAECSGAAEY